MVHIHRWWRGRRWGCRGKGIQFHCIGKLILPVTTGLTLATGHERRNGLGLYALSFCDLEDALMGVGDSLSG